MSWPILVWPWLAQTALASTVLLTLGFLFTYLCRQPVHRQRVIELTLLGCFLASVLCRFPGVPRWSAGLLGSVPPNSFGSEVTPSLDTGNFLPVGYFPFRETPSVVLKEATTDGTMSAGESLPGPSQTTLVGLKGLLTYLPWLLVWIFIFGAGFCLLRWLIGLARLIRLSRTASRAPPAVKALFEEMTGSVGGKVRLLVSRAVELPLTFGWVRPAILLPTTLCRDVHAAELRYCLAHEWSHIERHDTGVWYLTGLVQPILFFQPLYWWFRRHLQLCQDFLADGRAAEQAKGAVDYAAYLLSLARYPRSELTVPALGVFGRHSNLYRRILMLITNRQPLERTCCRGLSLTMTAGAVLLLLAVSAVRIDADHNAPQGGLGTGDWGPGETLAPSPQDLAPGPSPLTYTGKVTNKDTGQPIPGATVTVRRGLTGDPKLAGGRKVLEETKQTTDREGKFKFTITPEQAAERYLYIEMDAEAPGCAPRTGFGYALSMIRKNEKLGSRPFFVNIQLRPGKEITAVVETPSGKPAVGVKVQAYSATNKPDAETWESGSYSYTSARTDAEGRFNVSLITPGRGVFWLLPRDYAPSAHPVRDGQRGDQGRFTLQPGSVLGGKVLDSHGNPLEGISVKAERVVTDESMGDLPVANHIFRTAVTDGKGEFVMAPLPPGTYRVQPDEYGYDPSDGQQLAHRTLPAAFLPKSVNLTKEKASLLVELKAVAHVVVQAQYLDSKGKPSRGHECFIAGELEGSLLSTLVGSKGTFFWNSVARPDANGKFVIRVPRGLKKVRMHLITNEHGALRYRLGKDTPLSNKHEVQLGTLDRDVKGLEIIRYVAPILLVKVATSDGSKPKDPGVTATYPEGRGRFSGQIFLKRGLRSDVSFEEQEDGRFRSEQLLPDEEVTVTAQSEGCKKGTAKVKLAEGMIREMEIVLEKN